MVEHIKQSISITTNPMIDGIQKQWNLWNSDGLFFKIVKNANYDGKHHQMIENPNN